MPDDSAPINLTNHFLIAMPGLDDAAFSRSVVYVCEHSERGALGLVINKPSDINLKGLFDKVQLPLGRDDLQQLPVFQGGPVQTDRGFVLHRREKRWHWQSTLHVTAQISLTTSRDILESIAHDDGPQEALIALGYAGWGPGQLEEELAANAWLSLPAEPSILFEVPLEQRAQAAAARLGINLGLLSSTFGNA